MFNIMSDKYASANVALSHPSKVHVSNNSIICLLIDHLINTFDIDVSHLSSKAFTFIN